ncbi:uncharacterized protein LOC125568277 [Nematostella vectensis]|uniref:uncharacterized protein LOC125568277 n=1 Tax=Nematostella vectensis TaxID=45351 RepID=UPI002076F9A3|nr:uncharacterized protein LOC125568277 [Nematostella vectensis]
MAANFLTPVFIAFLAILFNQKLHYSPNLTSGINGFGLNCILANSESILTGLEAFYSHNIRANKMNVGRSSSEHKHLLLCLLLLGGDIQLNPGPKLKFPCGSCNKPVKSNQKGIQCDNCNLWYHTRCCSINDDLYYTLTASSCTWLCVSCGFPSFSSSLFESSSIELQNSFSSLDSLHQDTQNISSSTIRSPETSPLDSSSRNSSNTRKQSKEKLTGMILNCNGLKGTDHITKFQALINLHDPDFILGTESKLCHDISTYSIFSQNYSVFRRDRNKFEGGVFQAIKSDLVCTEEPDFEVDNCEIIWTSLKLANRKSIYMSSYYRPPNQPSDAIDNLNESIRRVFNKVKNFPNIIIGGDFNLGDIEWNSSAPTPTNPATASLHQKFLQTIDDFSLSQHVKTTTRPSSGKTLDLLLTTYPNVIVNTSTASGLSDHLAVIFEVNLKPSRSLKPPHKVYQYKKANFPDLCKFMSDSSTTFFSTNPEKRTVEENWVLFKTSLSTGISQFIPQKSSRPKYKLPWINTNIKREMRKKDRMHKKAIKSKNQQHWEAFKRQRNLVSKLIKDSHNDYLNNIIGNSLKDNPKKFWSYYLHKNNYQHLFLEIHHIHQFQIFTFLLKESVSNYLN